MNLLETLKKIRTLESEKETKKKSNKKESFKDKITKDKKDRDEKKKKEKVKDQEFNFESIESGDSELHGIIQKYPSEWKLFKSGNTDLSDPKLQKFYEEVYEYFLFTGTMPYGVAKARTGDPYDWIGDKLDQLSDETITELDKKTLGSYVKKAKNELGSLNFDGGFGAGEEHEVTPEYKRNREDRLRKINNKDTGINRAVNKLTKESNKKNVKTNKYGMNKKVNEAQINLNITDLNSTDAETLSQLLHLAGVAETPQMDGTDVYSPYNQSTPVPQDPNSFGSELDNLSGDTITPSDIDSMNTDDFDSEVTTVSPEDDDYDINYGDDDMSGDIIGFDGSDDELPDTEFDDFSNTDADAGLDSEPGMEIEPMDEPETDMSAEDDSVVLGDYAQEGLEDMLKLAGLEMLPEEDDKLWDNEPDEKSSGEPPSGGPNRAQHRGHGARPGDNPMSMNEELSEEQENKTIYRWKYHSRDGVERHGDFVGHHDFGGTDVTYRFKRHNPGKDDHGRLDLVSGPRLKTAIRVPMNEESLQERISTLKSKWDNFKSR